MSISVEELQTVKKRLYDYLDVGMSLERALTAAEVSPDMDAALTADTEFVQHLKTREALLEYKLLLNVHKAAQVQINLGTAQESRWLLGTLFPDKYGKKEGGGSSSAFSDKVGDDFEGL